MSINKYRIYCETESLYVYEWAETEPTDCPNNNTHTITTSATTIVDTIDTYGTSDSAGRLLVNNNNKVNLFGDATSVQYSPVIQNYSPYGVLSNQLYTSDVGSGGTIISNANGIETDIKTTTTANSYAILKSKKVLKYRPGFTYVYRGNVRFDTPVANSLQFMGIGNEGSEIYFCYDGLSFGIRRSTNGNSEVRSLTITVAENSTATGTITLNSVEYTVSLTNSGGIIAYTAHQCTDNVFGGLWIIDHIDDTIIFKSSTIGSKNGTYSFSSTGSAIGTFNSNKTGSDLTITNVPIASWNGISNMITTIDPLKNNMYEIEYSCFGSSNIEFRIYNPDANIYETVHTLRFANVSTEVSLSQPNLYIQNGVISLGSTTALTLTSSVNMASTMGSIVRDTPEHSVSNTKSIAIDTNSVILALKNRMVINGYSNQSVLLITGMSASTDGTRTVKITIIKNPTTISDNTLADYTNYQYIQETEALGIVDKTATIFTGGTIIKTLYAGKDGNISIDFTENPIELYQNDEVILVAFSAAANIVDAGFTIVDDL
jgi:hypothetical protein